MKSEALVKRWLAYMDEVAGNTEMQLPKDPAAIYLGTDEIKLDYRNNRVKTPMAGWIDMGGNLDSLPKFDWAALVYDDSGWSVVFLLGEPFSDDQKEHLPTKNGIFVGAPYAYLRAHPLTAPRLLAAQ